MTEQEITRGCRNRDRSAYAELYSAYVGRIMAICLRYCGNRPDAEDVAQDCFVEAIRCIRRFEWRGDGSLAAWLDRLCVNCCLDFLRKRKRLQFGEDICEDFEEIPVRDVPPNVLLEMISALPDGQRVVFNLHCIEEMSHKEVGRKLRISEGTSASQYYRARMALQTIIKEYLKK